MSFLIPQGQSAIFFQGSTRLFEATQIAVTDVATLVLPAADNTVLALIKLASGDSVALGASTVAFADGFLLVNPGEELANTTQTDVYAICDAGKTAVVCVWRFKASP